MKKNLFTTFLLCLSALASAQPIMEIIGAPPVSTSVSALACGGGAFNGGTGTFNGSGNGTAFGVNILANSTANLLDLQISGQRRFKIGHGSYTSTSGGVDCDWTANYAPTTGTSHWSHVRFSTVIDHTVNAQTNILDFRPVVNNTGSDFRVINIDYTHVIDNNKSDDIIRIFPKFETNTGCSATEWGVKGFNQLKRGWFSNMISIQGYNEIISTDTGYNSRVTGIYGSGDLAAFGYVNEIYGGRFAGRISNSNGKCSTIYAAKFSIEENQGTIHNTYGIYVDDVTFGTQTNKAFSLYVSDVNSRSYFASKSGFGVLNPVSMVDINGETLTGSATTPTLNMTQTWNTSGDPTAIKLNITNTASGANANLMDLQVGGVSKFKVNAAGTTTVPALSCTGGFETTHSNGIIFRNGGGSNGRLKMNAGNGIFTFTNGAETDWTAFNLGGNTSTFPSLRKNGTTIKARLADDSGDAGFEAGVITANSFMQITPITATAASALTPALGMFVVVSNTNGTFTQVGAWFYDGTNWVALH